MNKWFLSSDSSGDLSFTIKASLLGIVPVVVAFAKLNGIDVADTDLVALINNVFAGIALAGVIVGLARKIWFSLKRQELI